MRKAKKALYPVIHCVEPYEEQGIGHALANASIAKKNGADGVFLIGHGLNAAALCTIYNEVRKQHYDMRFGVNFLDIAGDDAKTLVSMARRCSDLNMLWLDGVPSERIDLGANVDVFAGVAFKYINSGQSGPELAATCDRVVEVANIATTSGDKTGQPPSIEKLQKVHEQLGGRIPLAVASGVSEENVSEMLPFVDIFLVASSISFHDPNRGGHEYLVPEKVAALAAAINP